MKLLKNIALVICILGFIGTSFAQEQKYSLEFKEESTWNGYQRQDFEFDSRFGSVISPKEARADRAWVFVPAFFAKFPIAEKAFLAKGFHVVYCEFAHEYANYKAIDVAEKFHQEIVKKYNLNPKSCLEGLSRGGAFSVNFANRKPDLVACLYLDAPVCDFESWPSRARKEWAGLCKKWEVDEIENIAEFVGNPINNIDNIAKKQIPIIIVSGDSDRTVPHQQNALVLLERYKNKGGTKSQIILEKAKDHHPHGLKDPSVVIDFVEKAYAL